MSLLADSSAAAESWIKALADSSASHGYPVTGPLKVTATAVPLITSNNKINTTKSEDMVVCNVLMFSHSRKDDITTVMKQSSSHQVKVFLDKVQEVELFFLRFDEILYGQFEQGISNPQQVLPSMSIIILLDVSHVRNHLRDAISIRKFAALW